MNENIKQYIVPPEQDAARLDLFLTAQMGLSRTAVKQLIDHGQVTRNGKLPKKAGDTIHAEDTVEVTIQPNEIVSKPEVIAPQENIQHPPIDIIEETDDYVVVNKPAGVLVHPNDTNTDQFSLAAWLLHKYPQLAQVGDNPSLRPGIVHRLDKDASGLLVVAKTQAMFDCLKKQFQARTVEKEYTVLVHGVIENDYGMIDFPIDRGKSGKFVARPAVKETSLQTLERLQPGKDAKTEFWVEQRYTHYSLVKVKIHTGRTHQIRVHMFAFGHPVVGDLLYTKKMFERYNTLSRRLFLHASSLQFLNLQENSCAYEAAIPSELAAFLKQLT